MAVAIAAGSSYFLSGVMQGKSASGDGVEGTVNQDYRAEMKAAILAADATARVVEPWDLVAEKVKKIYPEGTQQSEMFKHDIHVRQCFQVCVDAAASSDVVISYLPEASMGSAVELSAAFAKGKTIVVIAPGSMAGNWVVRSYANVVLASLEELAAWLMWTLQRRHLRFDGPRVPSGYTPLNER